MPPAGITHTQRHGPCELILASQLYFPPNILDSKRIRKTVKKGSEENGVKKMKGSKGNEKPYFSFVLFLKLFLCLVLGVFFFCGVGSGVEEVFNKECPLLLCPFLSLFSSGATLAKSSSSVSIAVSLVLSLSLFLPHSVKCLGTKVIAFTT